MTLAAGRRLGPYEVLAPLGAGGMGEVYRARDSRLGRDVAIKVLPGHLASDPELRLRFEREARAVSSLNHPNICVLHDVGHDDGVDYLVMELVDGETLADRIARGPAPPAEVLRIGIEVADALDRAHRSGVVHRDLKPGNVMLTRAGAKLMDFGLARSSAPAMNPGSLSQSPTMTRPLTAEGALVGTFQYMSPEQIEGREADARSDLWALGATLYEMATGQRAFTGRSQASLIASILKEEPRPLSEVAPLQPPALDRVVRTCLAKDPDDRIQTAHDVKLQLQWIREGGSQAGVAAPIASRRRWRERTAWTLGALAMAAAAALGARALTHPPQPVMRFEVLAPREASAMGWPRVSPDGRLLAFLASDSVGMQRIWIRPLSAIEAHPLAGTEGSGRPFWSADSRYLGYFADSKLRKVPVDGGPPVTLADARGGFDGSWGRSQIILFDGGAGDSIRGVPASGGEVRPYSALLRHTEHGWPSFLPDGRHFLFVSYGGNRTSGTIELGTVGTLEVRELGTSDGRVEYSPDGWLVFVREGTLLAQRFDARALALRGDPIPIGENVFLGGGSGDFSATTPGMLVYRGNANPAGSKLQWFDRDGHPLGEAAPLDGYRDVALSPDGTRLAFSVIDPQRGKANIWVRQLDRGTTSRLTFEDGDEINPKWSPDGQHVAFATDRSGVFRVGIRAANGLGVEDTLAGFTGGPVGPTGWSRDGTRLTVRRIVSNGWEVWAADVNGAHPPVRLTSSRGNDTWGSLSPDGRWVLYQSTEAGAAQVYVQSADGQGGKWQVSAHGGFCPRWRADGGEIYYQAPDGNVMAVPVRAGPTFDAATPQVLFHTEAVPNPAAGAQWDVSADGRKFVVVIPARGGEQPRFTVVMNWARELGAK